MSKQFHHVGLPTSQAQPNEIHLPDVKLFITDASQSEHHIEWVRCEPGSPMPELLKTTAHVAYTVDNLDEALVGKIILMPPWSPMPGLKVAFIQEGNAPVEYLEFSKP